MSKVRPISASESLLVDFDGVCQRVRAAVEPARAHAVSLHDELGDVLWLSESSMGPDEHNAVREAIEAFSRPTNAPLVLTFDLGDSHSAVLLRAVNAQGVLAGAIMVIIDTRLIKTDPRFAIKLLTPNLQRAITEFAEMRPGAPAPPAGKVVVKAATPAAAPLKVPTPAPAPRKVAAPPPVAAPPLAIANAPPKTPELDRLQAALRDGPITLAVQRLVPLTKGSQVKRYEVLLRSISEAQPNVAPTALLRAAVENGLGSMIDRRVVTELIAFLVHHPDLWENNTTVFSVNLTPTAIHDEQFIKFLELCLTKSSLPKGTIAFEVDAPTAVKLADRINDVAEALYRLGCPLVLDDFALRTECFDLLRLPGVRYIKLAPEITAKMRIDKVSQAAITAVVHMARVLGMHTVAKRTETAAEQEWLTALGVDFIQSNALSPPVAIETLVSKPH